MICCYSPKSILREFIICTYYLSTECYRDLFAISFPSASYDQLRQSLNIKLASLELIKCLARDLSILSLVTPRSSPWVMTAQAFLQSINVPDISWPGAPYFPVPALSRVCAVWIIILSSNPTSWLMGFRLCDRSSASILAPSPSPQYLIMPPILVLPKRPLTWRLRCYSLTWTPQVNWQTMVSRNKLFEAIKNLKPHRFSSRWVAVFRSGR